MRGSYQVSELIYEPIRFLKKSTTKMLLSGFEVLLEPLVSRRYEIYRICDKTITIILAAGLFTAKAFAVKTEIARQPRK